LADMIRVFLSVDINNPTLISKITNVQDALNQDAAKMKLVEKENIHFTWRFFGDTPLKSVDTIHEELKKLKYPSFSIEIGGVSAFPKINRPRVIWIGVTKNEEKMIDLKAKTDSLISVLGYKPEREFTPHATIARVRTIRNRDSIIQNLSSLSTVVIGLMPIDSISMTKSTLMSSGAIYETLWKIKLN
jgi:2'-5' RNA ligase